MSSVTVLESEPSDFDVYRVLLLAWQDFMQRQWCTLFPGTKIYQTLMVAVRENVAKFEWWHMMYLQSLMLLLKICLNVK